MKLNANAMLSCVVVSAKEALRRGMNTGQFGDGGDCPRSGFGRPTSKHVDSGCRLRLLPVGLE